MFNRQRTEKMKLTNPRSPLSFGFEDFWLKSRVFVSAKMKNHVCFFQVIRVSEGSFVNLGVNYFSQEYRVISRRELTMKPAFQMANAFFYERRLDFLPRKRCQACFPEFVTVSAAGCATD
jgi:hypothetical protein